MKKNINDISLLLAQHFLDIEVDPLLYEPDLKLVKDNSEEIGLYSKYLGRLHDSHILDAHFSDNKFTLKLNDFATRVFAYEIITKYNLQTDRDKLIFPVKLEFETSDITFNSVDEDGKIEEIKRTGIDLYLYDQILSVDKEYINVGIVVWKKKKIGRGKQILILLKAKSILLTEFQKVQWENLFGNEYDNYFNYFKEQFYKGRYLSDSTECKKLVDEYYKIINDKQ